MASHETGLNEAEMGRLKRVASHPTLLSDFGGFVAVNALKSMPEDSQKEDDLDTALSEAAGLGAHWTALFHDAAVNNTWNPNINTPETYYRWMRSWIEVAPVFEFFYDAAGPAELEALKREIGSGTQQLNEVRKEMK